MTNNEQIRSTVDRVKKSPSEVFALARKNDQGVYIYDRGTISGVMLTVEQYEKMMKPKKEETSYVYDQYQSELLYNKICEAIIPGTTMSAKNLDDHLASLGFYSKKISDAYFQYSELIEELNETGKLVYQLNQKGLSQPVFVEIIGEQNNVSAMLNKIIVKKIRMN